MTNNPVKRRKVLGYLGLGALGAGAAGLNQLSQSNSPLSLFGSTVSTVKPSSSPLEIVPAADAQPIPKAAANPTNRGKLPEFQGISHWINSKPLTVADLRGQVVLVQIWTFACINCQRTLPYVIQWHQRYAAKGLKVIGVHTPELAFEYQVENVKRAVKERGILYPVAIDNQYKTWSAYQNSYWPHLFLADRQGNLRYDHIGEGAYDQTEKMIQRLLA